MIRKSGHTKSFAGFLALFLLFSFTVPHLQVFGTSRGNMALVITKKTNHTRSDSQFPFEEQENEKEDLEDDSPDQRDNKTQQAFFFTCLSGWSILQLQAESKNFGGGQTLFLPGHTVHVPLYLAKRTLLI